MKKQETKSSIIFRHWFKVHSKEFKSCSFEMKDTRGKNTFTLKELKEEQINHALANKSDRGNLTRVASGTVGSGDYHFYRNADAYVVIKYPLGFVVVDIDKFLNEKKGINWQRAKEIATHIIDL